MLKNHDIDLQLLDSCYTQGAIFFNSELTKKMQLYYKKIDQNQYGTVGYFPYQSETAVNYKLADLKEFFHITADLGMYEEIADYYPNAVWPKNMEKFKVDFAALHKQFEQLGKKVLSVIAKIYDLSQHYVQDLILNGANLTRVIHYPRVCKNLSAMRAAPHTGINLIGICPRTTHPGLQFYTPTKEWVSLNENDFRDNITINIGEMLAYISNNKIKPTLHQVVNDQNSSNNESRYCIVHFFQPNCNKKLLINDENFNSIEAIDDSIPVSACLGTRIKKLGLQ